MIIVTVHVTYIEHSESPSDILCSFFWKHQQATKASSTSHCRSPEYHEQIYGIFHPVITLELGQPHPLFFGVSIMPSLLVSVMLIAPAYGGGGG